MVPSSFYGMGFAAGGFPAAQLVHPDRPALGFVGDGSFQMVMNTLPMAAEHRLGVTWCVLDDRALGSIRDIQQYRFGEPRSSPPSSRPARLRAASPGRAAATANGSRIPHDVDGALARALDANERGVPAVLDFAVARDRMLQTLEHYGFSPTSSSSGTGARSDGAPLMLGFGQPFGAVVQYAYVVEDSSGASASTSSGSGSDPGRSAALPAGGGAVPGRPIHRSLASPAFSGHAMIELIDQHDDSPSVFHEGDGPRRYGFHHWAMMTALRRRRGALRRDGYEEAFFDLCRPPRA